MRYPKSLPNLVYVLSRTHIFPRPTSVFLGSKTGFPLEHSRFFFFDLTAAGWARAEYHRGQWGWASSCSHAQHPTSAPCRGGLPPPEITALGSLTVDVASLHTPGFPKPHVHPILTALRVLACIMFDQNGSCSYFPGRNFFGYRKLHKIGRVHHCSQILLDVDYRNFWASCDHPPLLLVWCPTLFL